MTQTRKAELSTANKIKSAGCGLIVNIAANMILINGMYVATNFSDFRSFCIRHGIQQKNFKNYPFVYKLDGTINDNKAS